MRAVSDAFKTLVTSSHQMVARARLVTPGQEGVNPGPLKTDGTPLYALPIVGGDVTFDPKSEIRSTADVAVLFDWPRSDADPLHVYGNLELFVERGVAFGDSVKEWVSQGYFRITALDQEDAPDGPISIEAKDRMAAIINARLIAPRQFAASATTRAVVEALVREVYVAATVVLEGFNADAAIGSAQIVERDRYAFLNEIAKSHGCTMFFDYLGRFVMRPVPDPRTTAPVWEVHHGRNGVLVKVGKRVDSSTLFNAVVAEGEQASDEPPVRAVVYDDVPTSPTRWGGPFRFVPRFFSSSFLTTVEQCGSAARAMLVRSLGVPYTINFGMVPNPALEPLDVVRVRYSDRYSPEIHVLDRMTLPLTAEGVEQIATRVQPLEGD
jgi:hypothetical protein